MNHNQVEVTIDDGEPFLVDEGIVDVLKLVWMRGIETVGSCQDWGEYADIPDVLGYPGIAFDPENAELFEQLVGRSGWMRRAVVTEPAPAGPPDDGDRSYGEVGDIVFLWPEARTKEVKRRLR